METKEKRGPGCPPKDGGRTDYLRARCSPETKKAWESRAEALGISLGDLVAEIAQGWKKSE